MVIFGYRISHRPFTRFDFFKPVFLLMVPFSLWMAATYSGNFATYRLGDSIIPTEAQLQSSGPYVMHFRKTRLDSYVDFTSAHDGTTYTLRKAAFPSKVGINDVIKKLDGQPLTYLGLYLDNPAQQVWRVRVRGVELMTYERALHWYHIDPSANTWFIAALVNLFLFLCSWLTFTSTRPPRLTAQCDPP